MHKLIEEFKSGIKWQIGNGNISFWHDKWLIDTSISDYFANEGIIANDYNLDSRVNDFIDFSSNS